MIQTLAAIAVSLLVVSSKHGVPSPEPSVSTRVHRGLNDAIKGGRLAVFGKEELPGNAWGEICIGSISTDEHGGTLGQTYINWQGRYFYPASTIKLFAAIAAYEQLNAWQRAYPDASIGDVTPLRFYPLFEGDDIRETDPTNTRPNGPFLGSGPPPITVRHEMHKLFVVSDNAAFNTLYDLVGHRDLNQRMRSWGIGDAFISHRLSIARTPDENQRAPRVDIGLEPGSPQIGERLSTLEHWRADQAIMFQSGFLLGTGYLKDGEIVEGPFDFSNKNFVSLADLQRILAKLARSDLAGVMCCDASDFTIAPMSGRPFDLTDDQRAQLIRSATMLPRESESPKYDPEKYPDDYVKFLLPGLLKVRPLEEWRIVNKIGLAYGFVTENAYVEHLPSGNAVFVAAVIHRNPNGIYNDGIYDYETTLAEMATLGEVVGEALVGDQD
jgi:hypothetical protein